MAKGKFQQIMRLVLVWYLSNVAWNLYQLAHDNLNKLADSKKVVDALVLPGPLASPENSILAYASFILLVLLILLLSSKGISLLFQSGDIDIYEYNRTLTTTTLILAFAGGLWAALGVNIVWSSARNPYVLPNWYFISFCIILIVYAILAYVVLKVEDAVNNIWEKIWILCVFLFLIFWILVCEGFMMTLFFHIIVVLPDMFMHYNK